VSWHKFRPHWFNHSSDALNISWLIPVRDGRRWLREAIQSILDQSEPHDEIVVVDDGSVDRPVEVIPSDARVRVVHQSADGIVAALERGRSLCRNPLIGRIDADDVALPGRVEVQRRYMADHPAVAVVGGRAIMVPEHGPLSEGMRRYVDWVNGIEDHHAELLVESPLFHPSVLMRAQSIQRAGGYRQNGLPEDYDLWLRVVGAGYRISAVPDVVVRLRDHPDRLTRTHPRYRREAFDAAKKEWLRLGPLQHPTKIALWGAGRSARPWLRWLQSEGHTVVAVIDPYQGTSRRGVPVVQPDELTSLPVDKLFVAVGLAEARPIIRTALNRLRPTWVEGVDWWAVC